MSSIVARGKTHPKANISMSMDFFLIIILFKLLRSDKSFALAQTQFTLIAQA